MKRKILSLALLFVVGVSSMFLFSACGKKKYDLNLSYDKLPEHIINIYVEGFDGKTGKYEKDGNAVVIAECEQGYEPKLKLTLGETKVETYSSYWCINKDSATVGSYKYAYKYVVSASGLTGTQTMKVETDEATAVYDLKFQIDGEVNVNDAKYAGLTFVFSGLATDDVALSLSELVDYAKNGKTLKYTSGVDFTCRIYADQRFVGTEFLTEASEGIQSSRSDNEHITFNAVAEAIVKFVPGEFKLRDAI